MTGARAAVLGLVLAACGSIGGVGGIPIQRDLEDPMAVAVSERSGCPMLQGSEVILPTPAEVDEAVDAANGVPITIDIEGGGQLFVGTPEVAAYELGGTALFVGRDGSMWLRLEPGVAARLDAIPTPKGRLAWYLDDVATVGPC